MLNHTEECVNAMKMDLSQCEEEKAHCFVNTGQLEVKSCSDTNMPSGEAHHECDCVKILVLVKDCGVLCTEDQLITGWLQ